MRGKNLGGSNKNTSSTVYVSYSVGEEVIVGKEKFFVIKYNGDAVTLLAKYCLNRAGTAQSNVSYSIYEREYSSTNYWSSCSASKNAMIIFFKLA